MSATINGITYTFSGSEASVSGLIWPPHNSLDLVIPDTVTYLGAIFNVTSISDFFFGGSNFLKSVVIPNSVTSIGGYAFSGCNNLTSVTLGSSVASIGHSAFSGCGSLTSITIPSSVTSIGQGAFRDCIKLVSLIVDVNNSDYIVDSGILFNASKTSLIQYLASNTNTSYSIPSSVIIIEGYAFFGINLTSITIPSSVTSIGSLAFYSCTSLTSINIPNSVTSIGDSAFTYCSGLTSITIPSSVTSIGNNTFGNCTGITSLTFHLPSSVTSIGSNAFESCTGLTSVTIPNSVTSIGGIAFYACTSLKSINIPNSVTSIGDIAFGNCIGLTSITIPASVTSIGYATFDCPNLTSVTFLGLIPTIGDSNFINASDNIIYDVNINIGNPNLENMLSLFEKKSPIFPICFVAGTPVVTDQGKIAIDKISINKNTIRGKKIVAITKTVTLEDKIVCIEKDALGTNIPSQKTLISRNHKLFFNKQMIKAKYLAGQVDGVYNKKYNGEVLYNVLLETYEKMMVNNLIVETLDPNNVVAQLYNGSYSDVDRNNAIVNINKCANDYKKVYGKLR